MSAGPSLAPDSSAPFPWRSLLKGTALITAVALVGTSLTIVDETEAVVVERFGRIVAVYDEPEQRGLHFKLPWPVDVARRFDRRVQLFEPPGREVFTRDKKNITVDAYLCWRIAGSAERPAGGDPEDSLLERPVIRFYRGVGSTDVAEARLDTRIRSALSTALGRVDLAELLQVAGEGEEGQPKDGNPASPLARIAELVHADILAGREGDASLPEKLGIEIVDVRIRRLGFPSGNQSAVFERMRSERRKIAETYRSAGMAENRMIMSRADRHSNEVLARARADAERIRGEAEAESIRILNEAHAKDPELYQTLRTLDAYKAMLTEKTTLVLSASSELLKLLTGGIPDSIGDRPSAPKSTRAEERPSGDGR